MDVEEKTINKVTSLGIGIRPVDKDSELSPGEYRIAVCVGDNDYHFMMQHTNGDWSHKQGWLPPRLVNTDDVETISWDLATTIPVIYVHSGMLGFYIVSYTEDYYNSGPRYFAISKTGG